MSLLQKIKKNKFWVTALAAGSIWHFANNLEVARDFYETFVPRPKEVVVTSYNRSFFPAIYDFCEDDGILCREIIEKRGGINACMLVKLDDQTTLAQAEDARASCTTHGDYQDFKILDPIHSDNPRTYCSGIFLLSRAASRNNVLRELTFRPVKKNRNFVHEMWLSREYCKEVMRK
jgi:hypothetical protein